MKPKISIIIPVGNLLRDFSNLQEYLKIVELREVQLIIVIDDPAPNALTLGFLEKFNENHLNLRIVHSSYGNPGGARNIGIDSSDSDWITFWDSDDSVDLIVFKSVIDNVKLESNYMYASSLMLFSKKEKILEISSSKRFLKSHFIRNPGIWRCIIPSAIARDISFPQSKMGEDQVFLSFVLGKVSDIKFINYGYYFHQTDSYGSLTNVKSSFSELEVSIKEIEKIFQEFNLKNRKMIFFMVLHLKLSLIKSQFTSKFFVLGFKELFKLIIFLIHFIIRYPVSFKAKNA